MNKEIVKICKIHGELTIDKVGPFRNKTYKNGTRPTHYLCKLCRKDKRDTKPKRINANSKYEKINKSYKTLDCSYCKENKKIDEFNDYQLKTKYLKCKKCESKMNRHYYILATYKLTNEEYEKILKKQNYVCKICGQQETAKLKGIIKKLSVDHCHKSQKKGVLKIRGLLCHHCNQGLGAFRDNPDYLRNAANYLELNEAT
jgi:hypothetical protein